MKQASPRIGRINDVLHKDLAILIRDKCKDPRIGFVTITNVEVTNNLAFARIYVTVLEDNKVEQSIEILNKAAGFLRTELSHMAILRIIPKLKFVYDGSVASGKRIEELLSSV